MDYIAYVKACLMSFSIGLVIIYAMRKIAFRWGILDIPKGVLKNHKQPVPYLGGLAVYLTIVFNLFWHFSDSLDNYIFLIWILLGITGVLLVGLYDDLYAMKPVQKFVGQFFCIPFILYSASFYKTIFLSHMLGYLFSFFFIISLINAFNLIDVMDGLATMVALTSVSSFFCIALYQGKYGFALLLSVVIGSLTSFLWWNKPAARIYLGDAGALLYGVMIAPIPFFLSWNHTTTWGLIAPLAIVAIPLFEVTCLILVRLSLSLSPYEGSPHHFCHFLLKKKWSKNNILCWTAAHGTAHSVWGFLLMEGHISTTIFFMGVLFFLIEWVVVVYDRFLCLFKKPCLSW
ncbi:undecaprenyl/decaprenyl-phosphate alpha-N-acetylglucosaminyl 1-phosphate transferase [Candidatus Babeliales bacterium]|nr:undecaprenyl/decaprenyl-phosphate alpha-N-acetylglucosaminyl 1-phosphate transferase [Candidatus Babeliales bacterium]